MHHSCSYKLVASLVVATVMETETITAPLFKKRGPKANQIRKRLATPPPADSDSESGYTSTEDEGRRIKRRKKSAIVTATSKNDPSVTAPNDFSTTKYEADHSAQLTDTNDATKASDWYDEKSLLGTTRTRPIHSNPKDSKPLAAQSSVGGDGTYKGQAAYTSFIHKNPDHQKPKTVGPIKGSSNVRTITVTDFAPDVCKDYKQTGFCGFADSCKFLHAREDYKQGWELDKEWEKVGGKGKIDGQRKSTQITEDMDSEEEDAALENIPFACVICKESYKYPIVTKCGHYFCEACALKRYKKNPSCAVCGAGTGGVFNGAKQLKRLLEKKRERARKRREKAAADGEEVEEEEEEADEDEEGS